VLNVEARVVKSDVAVSEDLRSSLIGIANALEDVPERFKDWHPGSDGLVLDLVHPSMFPLIYGVSWVLPTALTSLDRPALWTTPSDTVAAAPNEEEATTRTTHTWRSARSPRSWGNYMWLPSNISFDQDGKAHIDSYINNLHPIDHKGAYAVLEKILDAAIPLWNEVLTQFPRLRILVPQTFDEDFLHPEGVKYPGKMPPGEENEEESEEVEKDSESNDTDGDDDNPFPNGEDNGEDYDDEDSGEEMDEWELQDLYRRWKVEQACLKWPEPAEFVPSAKLDGRKAANLHDFKDGLQVIFKMANIQLTPEKPEYPGGSWHIEGALNEHICASAIYYYDEENITENALAFRHTVDEETLIMLPPQVSLCFVNSHL
jgi:hypothetical protein